MPISMDTHPPAPAISPTPDALRVLDDTAIETTDKYLDQLRQETGYGEVTLVMEAGRVKFIRKTVSVAMC